MARVETKTNKPLTEKQIKQKQKESKIKWGKVTLYGLWIGMGLAIVAALTLLVIFLVQLFHKEPEVDDRFEGYCIVDYSELDYLIGERTSGDVIFGDYQQFHGTNDHVWNVLYGDKYLGIVYVFFYNSHLIGNTDTTINKNFNTLLDSILQNDTYKSVPIMLVDMGSEQAKSAIAGYSAFGIDTTLPYQLLVINNDYESDTWGEPIAGTFRLIPTHKATMTTYLQKLLNMYNED